MVKKRSDKKSFLEKISFIGKIVGSSVSFLFFIFFVVLFFQTFTSQSKFSIPSGNVIVVPLSGVITTSRDGGGFIGTQVIESGKIVTILKKISKEKDVKSVILEIDSPGGSPVASDEIARAVKNLNKTSVSVIREVGASGGYWIASSAQKIFANRMSITGSIGVVSSRLEIPQLLSNYNITYRRLVAGKYKDAGSPYKEMIDEEKDLFQKLLDSIHDDFIKEVSINRNLSLDVVKKLAHGFVFLGKEAKENGLIDELGDRDDAIKYIEKKLNITAEVGEVKIRKGLFDAFSDALTKPFFYLGKGITNSLEDNSLKIRT